MLVLAGRAVAAEHRLALVIGNNHYVSLTPDQQLSKAGNDARAVARTLEGMGFEVILKLDANRAETLQAVRTFAARIEAGDSAFFFFAGHGVQIGGNNFLLPADVEIPAEGSQQIQQLADQAIELHDLLARIQDRNAKFTMAVIDACRDNPFPQTVVTRGLVRSRGLAAPAQQTPDGLYVVYSAGANEQAIDSLGEQDSDPNSVFTREFVKILRQPGLTADQAIKKAREQVRAAARSVGRQQNPAIYDQTHGDFYFIPPGMAAGGAAAPAIAPPAGADAQACQALRAAGASPTAFDEYLRQFPQGGCASYARIQAAALRPAGTVAVASSLSAARRGGEVFRDRADFPEMVVIPAGRFMMGASPDDAERYREEEPRHPVSVAGFALARGDVTFAQWEACVADGGCNGYRPPGAGAGSLDRPVINVGWEDARAYVAWLNARLGEGRGGAGPYRLPTEAEWEYAARAGTATSRWWGNEIGLAKANCLQCGGEWNGTRGSSPVGTFPANPFGLWDMLGNVWQWTEDCWTESYQAAAAEDGRAARAGSCDQRVVRGGSWHSAPRSVRLTHRFSQPESAREPTVGFRVARDLP